jgi:flavin-dependent dehydrogenase
LETVANYDLIVVGGGPAGTAAAITAAEHGARVLLLERGKFPRHKVCGEFVSAESLTLLASLLDPAHAGLLTDAPSISRARLFVDGRVIETPVDPPAASIPRVDLDVALWESARSRGVATQQQATVQEISGSGPFQVATSAGEFQARALVNASGRWSNLSAAENTTGEKWIGVKAHFTETQPEASVDLYFFDGGYCGVQPVGLNSVNACAMARADAASNLSEVFELHPALKARSQGWQTLTEPVATSPLIFREPKAVRDGILMAGDAAAFVDPFVGDGISLALRSGALAAQCLRAFFHNEASLPEAARAYQTAYMTRFSTVFRTAAKVRRMFSLPRTLRQPVLFALEKAPTVTRFLIRKTR